MALVIFLMIAVPTVLLILLPPMPGIIAFLFWITMAAFTALVSGAIVFGIGLANSGKNTGNRY